MKWAESLKPAASEFGFGPRTTSAGTYTATIEVTAPYRKGKLLSTVIMVKDAEGQPVDGAEITIDGGMPQHGHGLPTKPRATAEVEPGRYRIDGVKFNMGGWWEFKLRITAGAASDSITFNIKL